ASARNVIERIFGVLKQRFRILLLPPAYAMEIQAQIPAALCVLHNFIRVHDPSESNIPIDDEDGEADVGAEDAVADTRDAEDATAMEEDNEHDFRQAAELRDRIAEAMWAQYQRVVLERGLEALDITEDEDENEDENENENEDEE
ncbi:hypothetical protein P692DRAFT_20742611, partial [Suillus brevipes Sb2]